MSTPTTYDLGVDAAQDTLAVVGAAPAHVCNQPTALRAWLTTLRSAQPTVQLICEATGCHYHALQIVAAEGGVPPSW